VLETTAPPQSVKAPGETGLVPKDIIGGKALYIEFADDYYNATGYRGNADWGIELSEYSHEIIIAYEGYWYSLDNVNVIYENDAIRIVDGYGLGGTLQWQPDLTVGVVVAAWAGSMSPQAVVIVFRDYDTNSYIINSYRLATSGKDGSLAVMKTDLLTPIPRQGGPGLPEGVPDEISVSFYNFIEPTASIFDRADSYNIIEETIRADNFLEDVAEWLQKHMPIRLRGIWYEGNKLFVDIYRITVPFIDGGYTGAAICSRMLIYSFSSFPGVEEIQFCMDGVPGLGTGHIEIGGPLPASKPG